MAENDYLGDNFENNILSMRSSDSFLASRTPENTDGSINLENTQSSDNRENMKKQKRTRLSDGASKKKKGEKRKRKSNTEQFIDITREFIKSIETSTEKNISTVREIFGDQPGCSVKEVMEDVLRLPQVAPCSEMHFFSMLLFCQKSLREMYNTLEDDAKFKWLEYCHGQFSKGLWILGSR
ncbi:hypothetical protein M5689_025392 [Euphorbia peplus]|nr:hypothetical protein M5689_025392 [Euphorbia peplus]